MISSSYRRRAPDAAADASVALFAAAVALVAAYVALADAAAALVAASVALASAILPLAWTSSLIRLACVTCCCAKTT